jgi:hypothetical protein
MRFINTAFLEQLNPAVQAQLQNLFSGQNLVLPKAIQLGQKNVAFGSDDPFCIGLFAQAGLDNTAEANQGNLGVSQKGNCNVSRGSYFNPHSVSVVNQFTVPGGKSVAELGRGMGVITQFGASGSTLFAKGSCTAGNFANIRIIAKEATLIVDAAQGNNKINLFGDNNIKFVDLTGAGTSVLNSAGNGGTLEVLGGLNPDPLNIIQLKDDNATLNLNANHAKAQFNIMGHHNSGQIHLNLQSVVTLTDANQNGLRIHGGVTNFSGSQSTYQLTTDPSGNHIIRNADDSVGCVIVCNDSRLQFGGKDYQSQVSL